MKRMLCCFLLLVLSVRILQATEYRFTPTIDRESLLRNPACGWILYDDAVGSVAQAEDYWAAQDSAARQYATIFYLRWRWSDMEPEEGRYAWLYDENFKKLIQGASDRGLRLAFRIYVNSSDNLLPATPLWVREAGARGMKVNGWGGAKHWTPYIDDPVFMKKWAAFITAFGRAFNDPARVDFIDGMGVGSWGECHTLRFSTPDVDKEKHLRWLTGLFAAAFPNVLLGYQFPTSYGEKLDLQVAIYGQDYVYRRDSLGSRWFETPEKSIYKRDFPRHPLFAEKCYWGGNENTAWKKDDLYAKSWKSWHDVHRTTVENALEYHANTLDLRTVADTAIWLETPELVKRFIREGGYRLAPTAVALSGNLIPGGQIELRATWENFGTGVLPNLNRRWRQKYRPAFALLAADDSVAASWLIENAEPGLWLKGIPYATSMPAAVPHGLKPGRYRLAVGILNRSGDGMPDLNLALKGEKHGAWHVAGEVECR